MARTKDFDEEEVLNKAVCLFWHKGYNGTSMQDVVDALGISRSSLYDTFGDKHALYVRALERYKERSGSRMCGIVNEAKSAKETIRQLLELTSSDLLNDEQGRGCFLVNAEVELAAHDTALKELIQMGEQQLENTYYNVIRKGQESGEISTRQDARALTRFMLNTIKGMQVSAKSVKDKAVFDDIIETALLVLE